MFVSVQACRCLSLCRAKSVCVCAGYECLFLCRPESSFTGIQVFVSTQARIVCVCVGFLSACVCAALQIFEFVQPYKYLSLRSARNVCVCAGYECLCRPEGVCEGLQMFVSKHAYNCLCLPSRITSESGVVMKNFMNDMTFK